MEEEKHNIQQPPGKRAGAGDRERARAGPARLPVPASARGTARPRARWPKQPGQHPSLRAKTETRPGTKSSTQGPGGCPACPQPERLGAQPCRQQKPSPDTPHSELWAGAAPPPGGEIPPPPAKKPLLLLTQKVESNPVSLKGVWEFKHCFTVYCTDLPGVTLLHLENEKSRKRMSKQDSKVSMR